MWIRGRCRWTVSEHLPWFNCLIGGTNDLANVRVELLILATPANRVRFADTGADGTPMALRTELIDGADHFVVFVATGAGGEQLRRVAFDVNGSVGVQAWRVFFSLYTFGELHLVC